MSLDELKEVYDIGAIMPETKERLTNRAEGDGYVILATRRLAHSAIIQAFTPPQPPSS
jgi:hypothetical protein